MARDYMTMGHFASNIAQSKYCHKLGLDINTKQFYRHETWDEVAQRVSETVFRAVHAKGALVDDVRYLIASRKFLPGGRYLYATRRQFHQVQNCALFRAEDSREGWSDLLHKSSMSLMTGAGIGVAYGGVRPKGYIIKRTGGDATGPMALMQILNETGRGVMQGGSRRSAIWAGLPWWHPDAQEFIHMKNWSDEVKAMKSKDFNFPATMDMTNISVQLDDAFFALLRNESGMWGISTPWGTVLPTVTDAQEVFKAACFQMFSTGEPGFSIDLGENRGEELRNACTEITSCDDSDICNLGSINLARIESLDELADVVEAATAFLLAGTAYSDVPTEKIAQVRDRNRRLGLGIMGVHEWLLIRGKRYGQDDELEEWLTVYRDISRAAADAYASEWSLSRPVKVRAIAPTGTIGIVAETTTGIEPIFCTSYKRRYLKGGESWHYEYVVDPTAARVMRECGTHADDIEDALILADDFERRIAFQAWVQQYVDHAISSTANLPQWGTPGNNMETLEKHSATLLKYLPGLRGVTCYPDGARGGQPLTRVPLSTAMKYQGQEYREEYTDICDITRGGSCGS